MKYINNKLFRKASIFIMIILFFLTIMPLQKISAIGTEKFDSVKIKSFGIRQFPVATKENLNTYVIIKSQINVLFRMFLIDLKHNETIELTQGYMDFRGDNGTYLLDFKNDFEEGAYKLKVWVKNPFSNKEFDDEKTTKTFNVISSDNFDINLIKNIKTIKLSEKNAKDINEIGINGVENLEEDSQVNEEISKDNKKIENKNQIDERKQVENDLIVKENTISKSSIALKNKVLGNTVGDKFIISGEEEGKDYKYKLHIYDVNNEEWIIDEKEYRESCEWVPKKPGVYLLDLWTKVNKKGSDSSINNQYDSWRIVPIVIEEPSNKVEIDSVIASHYPILPGDKLNFYIKSKNVQMVQYRVWLLALDTGKRYDITKGYTNFVDANDYYEIKTYKALEPGNYKLWIWARGIDCESDFDSYFSYSFVCDSNQPSFGATFAGDMKLNNKNIKVGEKLVVSGINELDNNFTNYRYKLLVYKIDERKWIIPNKGYGDKQEWIPDKSGKYILVLWVISDEFESKEENKGKKYEGIKLSIIDVDENEDSENRDGSQNSKESGNKKYTLVLDFDDLYNGIEKGYELFINNDDVLKVYKKAIGILNEIIKENMSDLEKIIVAHDYIVRNTSYGQAAGSAKNSYGVLIEGKAICQGYAFTMKMFLDMLEIENYLVEGVTSTDGNVEEHMWNLVRVGDGFYHIDATWNDPVPDEKGKVRYLFFLLTDEVMSKTHKWDTDKYKKRGKNDYSYFQSMYHPVVDNGWVYFSEQKDGYKLYKMRINDDNKIKLTNTMAIFIDTDENWIYFSNYSHGGYLYKIRKDGLGLSKLNDEYSKDIRVEGDWIIYKNVHNEKYYKIKKDGTEKTLCE